MQAGRGVAGRGGLQAGGVQAGGSELCWSHIILAGPVSHEFASGSVTQGDCMLTMYAEPLWAMSNGKTVSAEILLLHRTADFVCITRTSRPPMSCRQSINQLDGLDQMN